MVEVLYRHAKLRLCVCRGTKNVAFFVCLFVHVTLTVVKRIGEGGIRFGRPFAADSISGHCSLLITRFIPIILI